MKEMTKKITIGLLMFTLLLSQGGFISVVEARDAREASEADEAEKADKPQPEEQPSQEDQSINDTDTNDGRVARDASEADEAVSAAEAVDVDGNTSNDPEPTTTPETITQSEVVETGDTSYNENDSVGDPQIITGDANSNGEVYNLGNENIAATGGNGSAGSGVGGVSIVNDENGTNSKNAGSATVSNNSDTAQGNSAVVINNMNQSAISGDNNANRNVGEVNIETGDANVSATAITSANTNVAGVSVAEFNILDNHTGDYILDFAEGCISGCGNGDIAIANTGNGDSSDNYGIVNVENNDDLDQLNDGVVINNLDLVADSGHNNANKNTGGDINIETGDANIAANLLTFLNNNIAGGVMYGAVNIFGDMVGDIILPESAFDTFGGCSDCDSNIAVGIKGNGDNSVNNAEVNLENIDTTNQFNDGEIINNLVLEAETGENDASRNTGGDINVETGDSKLDASIMNIANMNMIGGNMWLVVVNEAGNWIGRLFGSDEHGKLAGSDGIEFDIDPNGTINVTNSGNGSDSTNNAIVNVTDNDNINQENVGKIENNLNLSAITGKNNANRNTNGDINIETGDAHVLANVVNYLNNNIVGGKLLVTFVNVFGSWEGDFLTPGSTKAAYDMSTQVGSMYNETQNESSKEETSSNNESSSTDGSSSSGGSISPRPVVIATGSITPITTVYNSANSNEAKVAVAGINNTNTVVDSAKKVNINLAWLILLLPIMAGAILTRKAYLIVKHKNTV